MGDNDIGLGDDAPAQEESKMYAASAAYFGPRLAVPQCINQYMAIRQLTFPIVHNEMGASGRFSISSSSQDANQLGKFDTYTNFNALASNDNSKLLNKLYDCYDHFRIRSIRYSFSPAEDHRVGVNYVNSAQAGVQNSVPFAMDAVSLRIPRYLWWCENHDVEDNEPAFVDWLSMKRSRAYGENISSIGHEPDKGFAFTFVPQVKFAEGSVAGMTYKDVPMPWMPTDDNGRAVLLRGPYILWQKPYRTAVRTEATWVVTVSAIIEFRNIDYSKIGP